LSKRRRKSKKAKWRQKANFTTSFSPQPAQSQNGPKSESDLEPGAELVEGSNAPFARLDGDDQLEKARAHWQVGDWEALASLANIPLQAHADRSRLALLASVGCAQLGLHGDARRMASLAKEWGCDRELLARVLIGGVYNSLARVSSLRGDEARASKYFEASISTVSPRADAVVLGRARNIHEKARLGQLPEVAALIGVEADEIAQKSKMAQTEANARLDRLQGALDQVQKDRNQHKDYPSFLEAYATDEDAIPTGRLLACCHHKSGTNFLLPFVRKLSRQFGIPLWLKFYDEEPAHWQMCLHQHARIDDIVEDQSFRGVHLVRHPMSLIFSATHYHGEDCPEPWAHIPLRRFNNATFRTITSRETYNIIKSPDVAMDKKIELMNAEGNRPEGDPIDDSGYDFEGKTYAEMHMSMKTFDDRIRFEMNAYSRGVLRDMLEFPADNRFLRVKLEDISRDRKMWSLRKVVQHLGFQGASAGKALELAAEGCLWNIPRPAHARTGLSEHWRDLFTGDLAKQYRHLYGWAEHALGYE